MVDSAYVYPLYHTIGTYLEPRLGSILSKPSMELSYLLLHVEKIRHRQWSCEAGHGGL